ncbi:hypothetical protein Ciccas_013432 [Cichlidogyrus casuarinus]|uniref:60S acidic ribosomal protein P2 n=1 Tax=Cichlidogyrus casuarinus TaxID=1844966 RepID=A0ABD2PKQ2_9PLAT
MVALSILLLKDGGKEITGKLTVYQFILASYIADSVMKVLKAAKLDPKCKYIKMFVDQINILPESVEELIKAFDMKNVASAGAAAPAAAAATPAATTQAKQPEPESSSDEDMGMDLFG